MILHLLNNLKIVPSKIQSLFENKVEMQKIKPEYLNKNVSFTIKRKFLYFLLDNCKNYNLCQVAFRWKLDTN